MKLLIGILIAVLTTAYAEEINICHGVPHNTFIRNVAACNGWFLCTPNGPQGGFCPDPWLFNSTTQQCDWEWNVQCFTCPTTQPIVNLRVEGSCVQFIRCINGHASQHACQNGLHFNEAQGQCDLVENAGCTVNFVCPPSIPPGQMVSFRDDTNCSVFHVCTGQPTPVTQHCNPVLHFDPVRQQCVFPNMTDCPHAPPDNGGGTTTPNPGGPTTTVQPPFNCPGDGHHPHPTDCDRFIVCAAGTPHFFNCSQGLHFNRNTNQCDLPQNAQCPT